MDYKSCIGLDPLRRCGRIIVGAGAQFVVRSVGFCESSKTRQEQEATFLATRSGLAGFDAKLWPDL
jgi:hypothetical protein